MPNWTIKHSPKRPPLPLTHLNHSQQSTAARSGAPQLNPKQLKRLVRDELTQFQNELIATLADERDSISVAVAAQPVEFDDIASQQANNTVDQIYNNALTSGQWSNQDRTELRESLHMLSEQRRNALLDKLIIAINSGEIETDGGSIF